MWQPSTGDFISQFLKGARLRTLKGDLRTHLEIHAPVGFWTDPEALLDKALAFGQNQQAVRLATPRAEPILATTELRGSNKPGRRRSKPAGAAAGPAYPYTIPARIYPQQQNPRAQGAGGPTRRQRTRRHRPSGPGPQNTVAHPPPPPGGAVQGRQCVQSRPSSSPAEPSGSCTLPFALIREREQNGLCGYCRTRGHPTAKCNGAVVPAVWGEYGCPSL